MPTHATTSYDKRWQAVPHNAPPLPPPSVGKQSRPPFAAPFAGITIPGSCETSGRKRCSTDSVKTGGAESNCGASRGGSAGWCCMGAKCPPGAAQRPLLCSVQNQPPPPKSTVHPDLSLLALLQCPTPPSCSRSEALSALQAAPWIEHQWALLGRAHALSRLSRHYHCVPRQRRCWSVPEGVRE